MCNLPIPAFTAHNQMAVTTTKGARIPQQVFLPSLRKKYILLSYCITFVLPFIRLYLTLDSYLPMFRCLHWSMKIKVTVLLAVLLMCKTKQIQLEMALA